MCVCVCWNAWGLGEVQNGPEGAFFCVTHVTRSRFLGLLGGCFWEEKLRELGASCLKLFL